MGTKSFTMIKYNFEDKSVNLDVFRMEIKTISYTRDSRARRHIWKHSTSFTSSVSPADLFGNVEDIQRSKHLIY